MADMSDYLEEEVLDTYFRNQTVYVALYSARTDENTGTELSGGNGYARTAASFGAVADDDDDATMKAIENDSAVTFPLATGSNGDATHWAIHDAETSGNQLTAIKALPATISYVAGTRPQIAAGGLVVRAG